MNRSSGSEFLTSMYICKRLMGSHSTSCHMGPGESSKFMSNRFSLGKGQFLGGCRSVRSVKFDFKGLKSLAYNSLDVHKEH